MPAESPSEQIVAHYRDRIANGDLAPGQRLPTNRALAVDWGTTAATVSRAMGILQQEGWVTATTAGTVVAAPERRVTAWPLTGRYARARAQGLIFAGDVSGKVRKATVAREWVEAPDIIAELLGVTPSDLVLRRRSRTYLAEVPVEETAMHFPARIVEAVPALEADGDIQVVDLIEGSGRMITRTLNTLAARMATIDEADLLRLSTPAVVFEHVHGTYAGTEPVEAVINVKPAEGNVLTFETDETP